MKKELARSQILYFTFLLVTLTFTLFFRQLNTILSAHTIYTIALWIITSTTFYRSYFWLSFSDRENLEAAALTNLATILSARGDRSEQVRRVETT
jgi:hypothetical protein